MRKRWMMALAGMAALGLVACLDGCSQADAVKAASTIHGYLPTVMGLASDAAATLEALDPSDVQEVQAVNSKVQVELQELESVSGAYAAAPTAEGWTSLQSVVDSLVSDADQGLLAALAIKNPQSQAQVKAAMSALDAVVHVLDGYLMAARSPDEVKAAAANRSVKVQSVVRYWSQGDWQRVEQAFGTKGEALAGVEMQLGF